MADLIGIYRVSREGGRSGDSYHSPREQIESGEAWAAANGHRIVKWFDESKSVSGKTIEREGLEDALAMIYSGHADGLIVMKVDRLSRDMLGGLLIIRDLEKAGKIFVAHKDGIFGDDNEMSKLILAVLLWVAEEYLKSKRREWEGVRRRHIGNGVANYEHFGYRKDIVRDETGKVIGGTRRLVPVPEEVPIVEGAFDRRAEGKSWRAIAQWMNDQGARTRGADGLWTVNPVRRLIQSRVYLGEITSGEIVNMSAHKAIITEEKWLAANAMNRQGREGGAAEDWQLTGFMRCSGCGVRMRGRATKGHRYYDCRRHFAFGSCPAPASIRADVIEEEVEKRFIATFLDSRHAEGTAATEELNAALAAVEAAKADLRSFLTSEATIEMGEALGQEWIEQGQLFRVRRIKVAEEAVAEARAVVTGVDLPIDLVELWPTLTVAEKKSIYGRALGGVAVKRGGGHRIWFTNDPKLTDDVLAGRGGVSKMTPIPVDDAPASAGEAAA